ncbi:DNA polymerase III subunit gamma and tau [Streptomyces albidoflavus]|uniref:DNA polymerase III subunit gamma and tau n=1 Tax=Streptomyces albidoflavus TaxID=1886 RepID=UPI00102082F7|nr:DNA polymerase III subunit gamma and tau [Streptomyces albidoflavus]RZE55471.1 DNA polymerase III subunit gamma and tau [Streptomyces albidoflavus]RZE77415.1 DNA polymerase III subunit gamma and tau [Streptomyces albidoflavus]WQG72472.1 DNA polymerase III subunit gamma and tau [Streptomyces albidoflavus]WSB15536.1 DNA polymerase III subunit gamma and tau [Streptomyces albidoflavus]WST09166.1 DNA polymerase III subunit gamma and tau [Streptomyces albidoflavus]
MSSLALYRRYRPESFAEVIGQEHVTDPLQQALRNNRVNHAYLFSGPRGCGKTTSARILARCLNCEQGPTPDPCGTCQSCQDLARNGPGSIDVIEIDAASHGGVDDARDLREKAFFGPASSRYKIYIIDEAHMVTSAGFNALLKVVEEPPEHLKFIFATTEPEKVIGTIRSRTHHYPFRLVPPGTLREYLAEVCGKEGSRVEDGVLPLVVRAGAGSVRDSMSVMDQLLAGAGEDGVTYAMATALLGYTDGSLLDSVVDAFAAGDGAAAFEVVDRVVEGGNDPRRFVADLLERLRDLVILAAVPDAAEKGLIDAPADLVERMQAQASVFGAAELSRAADLVNEGLTEMRGATSPRLQLELICARVLLPAAYDDERSTLARLERLERSGPPAQAAAPLAPQAYAPAQPQVPQAPPAAAPAPAPQQSAPPAPAPDAPPADAAPARPGAWPGSAAPGSGAPAPAARRPGGWPTAGAGGGPAPQQAEPQGPGRPQGQPQPQAAPATPPPGAVDARALWPNVLEAVKNRRRFTWILLSQNAHVAGFDGTTLQLGFLNAGARDNFASSGSEDVLKQALGEEFQVNWKIETVIDASGGQGPATPPGGGGWGQAPAPAQPRPAAPAPAPAPAPPQPGPAAPPAPAPASQAPPAPQREQRPPAPEPPRRTTSIEDDIPEEDDPDLDESALSGHDLIMRELGATVVEEYTNE